MKRKQGESNATRLHRLTSGVNSRAATGTIEAEWTFPLIVAHSINSTDAIALRSALAIAQKQRAGGDDLVLVASDQRLLRATQAEGLLTFDPETQDQAVLAAFLSF